MALAHKANPPETGSSVPDPLTVVRAAEIKAMLQAAEARGLMGPKDRQMGGRFPSALIDAAQQATGITEPTELITYALVRVAFEDNYGEKLLSLEGSVPRGTFIED
jgi:hypothetical protein